jgi:hypothetical protein
MDVMMEMGNSKKEEEFFLSSKRMEFLVRMTDMIEKEERKLYLVKKIISESMLQESNFAHSQVNPTQIHHKGPSMMGSSARGNDGFSTSEVEGRKILN